MSTPDKSCTAYHDLLTRNVECRCVQPNQPVSRQLKYPPNLECRFAISSCPVSRGIGDWNSHCQHAPPPRHCKFTTHNDRVSTHLPTTTTEKYYRNFSNTNLPTTRKLHCLSAAALTRFVTCIGLRNTWLCCSETIAKLQSHTFAIIHC